ncbi:Tat pathway signal protein [Arthrobacter sp. CDRTa11]|uniref:Tat pathway signal protein n=1 Tax=Arthrobacter sp. CDRTa11 TaxID=2651199 RepID=UPI002265EBE3|nr:Tat pathway signal protein [Arthrobacter sp. CDRTa11]UZX04215.1 Tat pathway signal protein [Arthrobacter sp. CDRTa11]
MDREHDPKKDRTGSSQDAAGEGRHPAAAEGDASAPPPASPKPPPWQVPKPELRPELLNEPPAVVDPFAMDRERQLQEAAARRKRSQRRTVVVGLGVTALLAGTLTAVVASNQDEPDYAQVCFNDETGERVEDANCNSSAGRGGGLYAWYFFSRGAYVPPLGQNRSTAPNFTRTIPSDAKASTGYSTQGGTVSRGGFGTSAKSGTSGGGGKVSGG